MIELLADNESGLTIAPDDTSEFIKWIMEYLKEPKELTRFEINGIIHAFDNRNHENCAFRSNLQAFLHNSEGRNVSISS